jgi:hypothetical protein
MVAIAIVRVVIVTVFSSFQCHRRPGVAEVVRKCSHSHVIGDVTCLKIGLLKSDSPTRAFKSSAIVLRAEHVTTVSDFVNVTVKMTG